MNGLSGRAGQNVTHSAMRWTDPAHAIAPVLTIDLSRVMVRHVTDICAHHVIVKAKQVSSEAVTNRNSN